mmetsp:Transcript_21231/g.31794  ORF Transcript_21231/g.31794 Transcript_21231/m.31794 type:complete len:193 (-) Transcript_21231:110-688(-)
MLSLLARPALRSATLPLRGGAGAGAHRFFCSNPSSSPSSSSSSSSSSPPKASAFEALITGDVAGHKLFETAEAFAYLNTHPAAPRGAAIVLPRHSGGHASIFDMPDEEAAQFVQHVPRAAMMVQEGLKAESVCCLPQAEGSYPHVHILPGRSEGSESNTQLAVPPVSFDEGEAAEWQKLAEHIRACDEMKSE